MIKYVALLRGIGPGTPNMRNEKLRPVFEKLGFTEVKSVISSGNILFSSKRTDTKQMETDIENALQLQLNITSTTIIRSQEQIATLLKSEPFPGLTHGQSSFLMATFMKHPTQFSYKLPYKPDGKPYYFIAFMDNTLFSVTDNTVLKTTDLMTWIEKEYGKAMTSRSWDTVKRIDKKFETA